MVDFPPLFYKGDNFCDFLVAFLYTNTLLKSGLLFTERIDRVDPFSEGGKILTKLPPLKMHFISFLNEAPCYHVIFNHVIMLPCFNFIL